MVTLRGHRASFLMLHLTLGCNAQCRHCVFECGPNKMHLRLTPQEVIVAVRTARKNGIMVLGLTGGEPFLAMDLMEVALKEAAEVGMPYSYVATNAVWATTATRAHEVLAHMASLGLRRIQVSHDHYHAEYVGVDRAINACQAAEALGYRVQVNVLETHDAAKDKACLDALTPVHHLVYDGYSESQNFGPPVRMGRGAALSDTELGLGRSVKAACLHLEHHMPLLDVFPGRLVSFCGYANPRMTYRYPMKRDWLASMLRVWNRDRCVTDLWNKGLATVIPEPITEVACGYCLQRLAKAYPDKEMLDVRRLP